jgi:hypothetical protein
LLIQYVKLSILTFLSQKSASEIQLKNKDHYSNLSRTEIVEILQDESPEIIELLSEFKEQLLTLKDTLTPILEK